MDCPTTLTRHRVDVAASTSTPSGRPGARAALSALVVRALEEDNDPHLEGVLRSDSAGVIEWVHPVSEVLHRLSGPARVDTTAHHWFRLGVKHREGGPAWYKLDDSGAETWYCRGEVHRLDGPAWTKAGGKRFWYVHGVRVRDLGDSSALEDLYASGETALIESVLSLWQQSGPSVAELVRAVQAAHA